MAASRFPHLKDANAWPGLRTVDPFALQVSFDPYLWGPDVVIYLCKTRLDAEYQNVGGWETAAARDAWFDSRAERQFRLESEFHVLPGSEIKLPIAFEVLNHYNQLFIDFPPTETEDGSNTSTRYYFFISDVQYRSPSSTACVITVDEWSTHMFDIDMEYIDLDRGHAPMAAVTADQYLSNPRNNCGLLTATDESYGHGERLRYTARNIINAGPHWLVIAMTADPEQDPGTYGHRENWRVPTTSAYRVEGALSQSVFAVEPSDANFMINRINERAPQLLATIQAVFLIPKRYVTTGTEFTFLGVSCHEIEPVQNISNFLTLSKGMFGYPSQYEDIAKLYTSPYAWIELTDETGRIQTIQIEDTTGQLRISVIASILAPFLGVDVYIAGIGTSVESDITWDNLLEHHFTAAGDWTTCMRHWNIPCYAVIQNSERAFEWVNHWQRIQSKLSIDSGYNIGIANNNLNYSLRGAALDRQVARLGEQQTNDSTQLALSNAAASDTTDANLAKTYGDIDVDRTLSGQLTSLTQNEFALAASNANATSGNVIAQSEVAAGLSQSYRDHVAASGTLSQAQGWIDLGGNLASGIAQEASIDTQLLGHQDDVAVQTAHNLLTDSVNLMRTYEDTGYANLSAESGVQTASLQLEGAQIAAANAQSTYALAMSNNQQVHDATDRAIIDKYNYAAVHARAILSIQQNLASDSLSARQAAARTMLNGDVTLNRAQIAATKGMSDQAITARRDLGDESLANAHRAGRLGTPKVFSQPTGSLTNYTRPQVMLCNIKTQDMGAIAAAGDFFLRYGYALSGRQWRVTSLNVMGHFTFWKGEPRFGADSINEVTRSILSAMFREGTFVWRNPDDIGSISIYDN